MDVKAAEKTSVASLSVSIGQPPISSNTPPTKPNRAERIRRLNDGIVTFTLPYHISPKAHLFVPESSTRGGSERRLKIRLGSPRLA